VLDQAHELLFFLSSRLLLPHALLSRSSIAALFLFALHAVLAQDGTGSNKTGDDVVELLFKWFGRSVAPSHAGTRVKDLV
jgi:hypothetical protein